MKKDKDWLKDEVARIYDTRDYWSVDDLRDEILDSINELDEPEVPVVPEDVYEHIKMNKVGGVPLDIALDGAIEILWGDGIQFHEFRNNQDNYARAWLAYPDIEIEEEPLFYVELIEGAYLEYYPRSGNFGITGYKEGNHGLVKLTEDRIKSLPKGDVLFEHFAVKVEELEE